MRTPPFLMAAALLFWGWENGSLLWAALLAAALEGARLTRTRLEFSDTDLNRISDLCWALVAGAALLLYSTGDRLLFLFKLVQWLPLCFCPVMLAQAYGNRDTMPLSVFWWLLRRAPASPAARKAYNISYCYFAVCLLAASASTSPDGFFYPGVTLLVALALTSARPRPRLIGCLGTLAGARRHGGPIQPQGIAFHAGLRWNVCWALGWPIFSAPLPIRANTRLESATEGGFHSREKSFCASVQIPADSRHPSCAKQRGTHIKRPSGWPAIMISHNQRGQQRPVKLLPTNKTLQRDGNCPVLQKWGDFAPAPRHL